VVCKGDHSLTHAATFELFSIPAMNRKFAQQRWSTPTLLGVGVALGVLGFALGRSGISPLGTATPNRATSVAPIATTSLPVASVTTTPMPQNSSEMLQRGSMPSARSSENESARMAELEKMAAHDPTGALALAEKESNWRLRSLLRNAALRGWASVAPAEAASYAVALPERERTDAVAAVVLGASNQPEAASAAVATLCAQDPLRAEEYGRTLIEALSGVGAFETLVRFSTMDPSGHRADWLNATFYQWAERQPAEARHALESLADPAARAEAFAGLAHGWALADPRELANYAVALPEGENRSLALRQALAQWFSHEPEAVANWTMRFDPGPDFDLSAAAVATLPKFAVQQPNLALGWAQSIVEPTLRESTLTTLAREWRERQPDGARRLIAETTGLSPSDRQVLFEALDRSGAETP
jgi:hypothetical protein